MELYNLIRSKKLDVEEMIRFSELAKRPGVRSLLLKYIDRELVALSRLQVIAGLTDEEYKAL